MIGAAKAGTTALHRYLDLHPEISMSADKEPHVFAYDDWRSRMATYETQFEEGGRARGESSPSYSMHPWIRGVPERIGAAVPDVRLV